MSFSEFLNYGFAKAYFLKDGADEVVFTVLRIVATLLCIVAAYLIGSCNCAILVSRKYMKDDIRNYGSKNAGSTNMLRTYGKKAALLTFAGDFLKALPAIFIGRLCLGGNGAYIAALFCVIGHIFPLFFKGKGGKGVATTAGAIFFCDPLVFLVLFVVYAIIVIGTKYVSLASVMSMLIYPLILNRFKTLFVPEGEVGYGIATLSAFAIAIIVILKHTENIKRILNHTESKLVLFGKNKGMHSVQQPSEDASRRHREDDDEPAAQSQPSDSQKSVPSKKASKSQRKQG